MTSIFFFFFSSRRGHTRLQGDWSSDVCSSDLPEPLSTSMPASSQKPARRPPPSSSVPRKPMRLMLAPPVDRPVLEGPEPFRCVTPTSTTPKISTLDCAEAAPGKDARQASATPSMGVWMVFMGLSPLGWWLGGDRKSTRLNSSHLVISYAVFCLKKKTKNMDSIDTCLLRRGVDRGDYAVAVV